jgi:hypothetical protein
MCLLFDVVSPARRFKRGMVYDDDATFPEYDEGNPGDITETDGDPPGWMPYMPRVYQ